METSKDYIAEDFTATIPVADYIAHYRDAEKFIAFCLQCRRYNTCWACPPFTFNVDQYLSRYETALIVGTKITPLHPEKITDPIAYGNGLMETERRRTDELLLEMEKMHNGRAFFPGSCLLCPSCTRTEGAPCLYPEKVRPSLEACGFDIGKTTTELLNIELKWGESGKMPEYITLVSAVFFTP
ncbi:DUF2284 domain-containing protein [Bacteroides thetaiotaomicron]|uniref:DUF2284 domain-containing protein n=1 Tax=Bacteroides thetaiotaomicron TaxID=818 RepID=A0A7J5JQV1_BACT4|nr:DUF2284 domain-containing protein [Bacteroides thetaiotaomicron]